MHIPRPARSSLQYPAYQRLRNHGVDPGGHGMRICVARVEYFSLNKTLRPGAASGIKIFVPPISTSAKMFSSSPVLLNQCLDVIRFAVLKSPGTDDGKQPPHPGRAAPIKTISAIGKRVSQEIFSSRRFCDNPIIRLAGTILKARRLSMVSGCAARSGARNLHL